MKDEKKMSQKFDDNIKLRKNLIKQTNESKTDVI